MNIPSAIEKLKKYKKDHAEYGNEERMIESILSDLQTTWYLHVLFHYPNGCRTKFIIMKGTDRKRVESVAMSLWNNKVDCQFMNMAAYAVTESDVSPVEWNVK